LANLDNFVVLNPFAATPAAHETQTFWPTRLEG
jgi:hypothetical protein